MGFGLGSVGLQSFWDSVVLVWWYSAKRYWGLRFIAFLFRFLVLQLAVGWQRPKNYNVCIKELLYADEPLVYDLVKFQCSLVKLPCALGELVM